MDSYNVEDEVNFGVKTEEWDLMSDFEKKSCLNRLQNYNVLKALGFEPTLPEFLKPISTPKIKRSSETAVQPQKVLRSNEKKETSNENGIRCKQKKNGQKFLYKNKAKHLSPCKDSCVLVLQEKEVTAGENKPLIFSEEERTAAIRKYNAFKTFFNIWNTAVSRKKTQRSKKPKKVFNNGELFSEKLQTESQDPKTACAKKTEVFDNRIDELLFCDVCGTNWEGACPFHGPLFYLADRQVVVQFGQALHSTPLQLNIVMCENGIGVWSRYTIPPMVLFGPFVGEITSEPDDYSYSWPIIKNGRVSHYISCLNIHTSNWMRFLMFARFESEVNALAFQYKGEIYLRTIKEVLPHTELKLCPWLHDTSFRDNSLPTCQFCTAVFHSKLFLKTHIKYSHRRKEKNLNIVNQTEKNVMKKIRNNLQITNEAEGEVKNARKNEQDKTGMKENCNIGRELENISEQDMIDENKSVKYAAEEMRLGVINTSENRNKDGCFVEGMRRLIESKFKDVKGQSHKNEVIYNKNTEASEGCNPAQPKFIIYKCEECDFNAEFFRELKHHKIVEHSKWKCFTCPVCQCKFTESRKLNIHMKTHKSDKLKC